MGLLCELGGSVLSPFGLVRREGWPVRWLTPPAVILSPYGLFIAGFGLFGGLRHRQFLCRPVSIVDARIKLDSMYPKIRVYQATGILKYTATRDGYAKDRLVFCNAASNAGWKNLFVRISEDGGWSLSDGKVIDLGPSAYSEITILADTSFGGLYEPGYKEVRFVRFTLDALTDGKDRLIKPFASAGEASL